MHIPIINKKELLLLDKRYLVAVATVCLGISAGGLLAYLDNSELSQPINPIVSQSATSSQTDDTAVVTPSSQPIPPPNSSSIASSSTPEISSSPSSTQPIADVHDETEEIPKVPDAGTQSSLPPVEETTDGYYVIEYKGMLAVVKDGETEPDVIYDIYTRMLPETDRALLQDGIYAQDYSEMISIVEDYIS